MDSRNVTDQQQLLAELARTGSENRQESAVVISPGARVDGLGGQGKEPRGIQQTTMCCAVVITVPGSTPIEIGEQMEAVNLAEPFLSQGTVAAGKYGIMCRVGEVNVFYAVP